MPPNKRCNNCWARNVPQFILERGGIYHNILKVQKCIPIDNWTARATSDLPGINKCYIDLPVNATFLDDTTRPAFLQTRTMSIRFTIEVGSCKQHRYKSVKVGDRIIVYDQILGKAVRSASITSFVIGHPPNWTAHHELHPHIFKNFIVTNFSDDQLAMFKNLRFFKIEASHKYTEENTIYSEDKE